MNAPAHLLHNMGMPRPATVPFQRPGLPGRLFGLSSRVAHLLDDSVEKDEPRRALMLLRQRGGAVARILVEQASLRRFPRRVRVGATRGEKRTFEELALPPDDVLDGLLPKGAAAVAAAERDAAREMEKALDACGVPRAVGVFLPAPEPAVEKVHILSDWATLAVLSRRSGPLYLPTRPFEPSLISLEQVILAFPAAPEGGGTR